MLFDGLMRQSEINCLLDELFGGSEGASLDEAEAWCSRFTRRGRGRTPTMPSCSLRKAACVSHNGRSATRVSVSPGSFLLRKSIACT